jgi:hypothetical protein
MSKETKSELAVAMGWNKSTTKAAARGKQMSQRLQAQADRGEIPF